MNFFEPKRYHLILFTSLSIFLSSLVATSAFGLEKVKLKLKWKHQFQFAGFYAAQTQGFYKEAGLDVEISERKKGEEPLDLLLDGKYDYALSDTDFLIQRLNGKPLVAVAVIFQHSAFTLISGYKSRIDTPAEFIGKKIMISNGSGSYQFHALLNKMGIPNDSMTFVEPTWRTDDLMNGSIDVQSGYQTNEVFLLRNAGFQINTIDPIKYGVDFYGDTIVTTEDKITKNYDQVVKFRNASLKGWEYAFNNRAEIIDYIFQLEGVEEIKKTRDALRDEADAMEKLILPKLVPLGTIHSKRLHSMASLLEDLKLVKNDANRIDGMIFKEKKFSSRLKKWIGFALTGITLVLFVVLGWIYVLRTTVKIKTRELDEKNKMLTKKSQKIAQLYKETKLESESRGMFLRSVSHELKTPLTSILGFAQLIEASNKEKQQVVEDCKKIIGSANCMHSTLKSIFLFYQLKLEKLEINPTPIHLRETVKKMLDLFDFKSDERSIAFSVGNEQPHHSQHLKSDQVMVEQVIFHVAEAFYKLPSLNKIKVDVTYNQHIHQVIFAFTSNKHSDLLAQGLKETSQEKTNLKFSDRTGVGLEFSKEICALINSQVSYESSSGEDKIIIEFKDIEDLSNQKAA